MRIDRRLTFIGIMLVVLSMTMATQYASTKIGFAYSIVHPSNADIRFIASDNSSDGYKVLRLDDAANLTYSVKLVFGNWSENTNKTYTAAFCIVNEEKFPVNITHINVTTTGAAADCMQIWLHGNRSHVVEDEVSTAKVWVWNKASLGFTRSSCVWVLGTGNGNPTNMNDGDGQITNPWTLEYYPEHVRYSVTDDDAINGTSDYVWVQISIEIDDGVAAGAITGALWVNFAASTIP